MRKIFQSREHRKEARVRLGSLVDDIHSMIWRLSLGGHLRGANHRVVMKLLLDMQKDIRQLVKKTQKEKQNRIQARLQKLLLKTRVK